MSEALILTARFDEVTQGFFQSQRDAYFPAGLNIVPAHLTLFHNLPGHEHAEIVTSIERLTADAGPLPARIVDVRFFGRGGAYVVDCPHLTALRARLAREFEDWLVPQDRQTHRPHVTYQNKATKAAAERAYAEVVQLFAPFDAMIVALDLWWYRRHWDDAGTFPLNPSA